MNNLKQYREDGYVICLPQKPKLDTGIINKLQCQLMCRNEAVVIRVTPIYEHLVRGVSVVDENGDLVTALDDDLDKKFVISERDINLYFALKNKGMPDDVDVIVEIVPFFQGRCR